MEPVTSNRAGSSPFGLRLLIPDLFHQGLSRRGEALLLIGRVEIEVNAAERTRAVALAQDDGDLLIEGDAMAQVRPAPLVGLDRLVKQGGKRRFEFIRGFVDAYDVFLIRFHRFRDLLLEDFCRHRSQPKGFPSRSEAKRGVQGQWSL